MLNFTAYIQHINYRLPDGLSSGVHGWIDLCRLWKKQRFNRDRGWAVWKEVSQHTEDEKRRLHFISIHLLLFSIIPFLLAFLLSVWLVAFQRQKQSFLLIQKGRAGSCYFERNMKAWSGHSMLILDWAVAIAGLYSLPVFVHIILCVINSFFVQSELQI